MSGDVYETVDPDYVTTDPGVYDDVKYKGSTWLTSPVRLNRKGEASERSNNLNLIYS